MAIQAQFFPDQYNLGFSASSLPWVDSTCGFNEFCFNLHQKQQMQHQQHQYLHTRNQNMFSGNGFLLPVSKTNVGSLEIDQFILQQSERLRLSLHEFRKQQMQQLVTKLESKASGLIKQKDEEIQKANYRTMELENFLRKLEMERQAWQRMAQESQATVESLNQALQEMRENVGFLNSKAEDSESCSGEEVENEEEHERKMVCKSCNSGKSCVLFLPCRHLCSCKTCDAFLDCCPVCRTVKKASVEAIIF